MAKPVSQYLEEEIVGLKNLGIDIVVSLLEISEQLEVGLSKEQEYCKKYGIKYISFPIEDRGVPELNKTKVLAEQLVKRLTSGKTLLYIVEPELAGQG